ncbi:unnamed protein product, partial [Amoebophrya sp. A120]
EAIDEERSFAQGPAAKKAPTMTTCEVFEVLQKTACVLAVGGENHDDEVLRENGNANALNPPSSTPSDDQDEHHRQGRLSLQRQVARLLQTSGDCFDHTPFTGVQGPGVAEFRRAIQSGGKAWTHLPARRKSFARSECVVRSLPEVCVDESTGEITLNFQNQKYFSAEQDLRISTTTTGQDQ